MFISDPNGGQPAYPEYQSAYDPRTMQMLPELQARLDALKMNRGALNKFSAEAMRSGPSPWANMQAGKQHLEEQTAREKLGKESSARAADARSQMAMRGGVTSGASERLARGGARDALDMSQDLSRQGMVNRMQIGVNDEQNRIQQLSQVPGMESQAFGQDLDKEKMLALTRNQDLANLLKDKQGLNSFNMDRYGAQMGAWGANQQAKATENSGK